MNVPGIINLTCKNTVAETVSRLESLLKVKGLRIFARIDQGEEAASVALAMRPMVLLLFGDPKAGIPIIIQYPSIAIDVPFRVLVWESADGTVWLTYNSAEYLEQRHGLQQSPFEGMIKLLQAAT